MKTTTQNFTRIPSNVDDHGRRIKDYDLRIATWNVRTLHRVGERQDRDAILAMSITAAMLISTNLDADLWLVRDFATLPLGSHL